MHTHNQHHTRHLHGLTLFLIAVSVMAMEMPTLSAGVSGAEPEIYAVPWWAQALKDRTGSMGLQVPSLVKPVSTISACTGSFAEAAVFKDWHGGVMLLNGIC